MGDDLDELIATGRRERSAGRLGEAEAVFSAARARYPADARPLVQRGAVLVLAGRYDDALADYRTAQRLDPTYAGLDAYFAEVYLYTGRPADALALSDAAAVREPDDLMHRINVAHAHLQLGHTDTALVRYADLADELHPTKQRTGGQLVVQDLELFTDAGVAMPGADEVVRVVGAGEGRPPGRPGPT